MILTLALWVSNLGGCATTEVEPLPTLPETPVFLQVPHPTQMTLSDLRAVLQDPQAPKKEALQDCEVPFEKLKEKTTSRDELLLGMRELVARFPVKYHWCFYSRLLEIRENISQETYLNEKQSKVLSAYAFLAPLARAFHTEFRDSRYLRWASQEYRQLSELYFYRKLEPSSQTTEELLAGSMAFPEWNTHEADSGQVLSKYSIPLPKEDLLIQTPAQIPNRAPAALVLPKERQKVSEGPSSLPAHAPTEAPQGDLFE